MRSNVKGIYVFSIKNRYKNYTFKKVGIIILLLIKVSILKVNLKLFRVYKTTQSSSGE